MSGKYVTNVFQRVNEICKSSQLTREVCQSTLEENAHKQCLFGVLEKHVASLA